TRHDLFSFAAAPDEMIPSACADAHTRTCTGSYSPASISTATGFPLVPRAASGGFRACGEAGKDGGFNGPRIASQRLLPHRRDDAHGRLDGGPAVLGGDLGP